VRSLLVLFSLMFLLSLRHSVETCHAALWKCIPSFLDGVWLLTID